MNKYWQLFLIFRSATLMRMMEYRVDFLFWLVVSIMWTVFNFFFFYILTTLTPSLAGWERSELFILVATFTMIDAVIWSFFFRNMLFYTRAVFTGFLDFLLTKPVDIQYMITTQDNSYTNIARFFIGFITLIVAIKNLPYDVSLFSIVLYWVLFFFSLLLIYSLWFFCATFSFWVEKIDNINDVFPSMKEIFRVPRSVYTGVFSFTFTTILPILLITSIPSEVLVRKTQPLWILYFVGITIFFFFMSRKFFQFSLKKYAGVGS